MKVAEIKNQLLWNNFFNRFGSNTFLEAWEWGEFEKKIGYDIVRLGIYDKNQLQAIALVTKIKSKRGNFLFVPQGPIIRIENRKWRMENLVKTLKDYLINLAIRESYSFIRIAPILEDKPEYRKIFNDLGFKTAPIYMHAERVWILPLEKKEEELITDMRKTTRYLIRKAQRENVVVKKKADLKALDDFYKIYKETAKREKFIPFSKKFIKHEFEAFHKTGNSLFFSTKTASSLILFTKSTAFYHQGASLHSKIPEGHLLQWEAIREAKRRGCKFYNFWGVFQPGRTPKSWQGLSLFKSGFGGSQLDYIPTQDFIISPKYYLTYLFEKILAAKRGV